jgi:hypothetical protein
MNGQIDKLIKKYKKELEGYRKLRNTNVAKGTVNFGFQETENYGAYLGKIEILEEVLKDLTILKM